MQGAPRKKARSEGASLPWGAGMLHSGRRPASDRTSKEPWEPATEATKRDPTAPPPPSLQALASPTTYDPAPGLLKRCCAAKA
mmetsp:Transcript_105661/g.268434  ORF Transcript_105661/g.268434 Transcript_105661/m.268434 type:complete len:83 (+) Transcript_105661:932-1180(+)